MAPWHPELPVFAFLSAIPVLVPLSWHWRARNVATMAMTIWFFVVGVIFGVNTVLWKGHARDIAPVYCDITTKVVLGASYAIPFATLCVTKHMEMASSSRIATYTIADRKRRMLFESGMCFGLPLVFMALHYVVQGHRYDIIQGLGCTSAIYISVPAVFIIWFPPLLASAMSFVFAALSLHHFIQRRLVFAAHLQNSNLGLSANRYLRLIAMSITTMFWGTSIHSYIFYVNVAPGLRPWTGWADVHYGFSRVDKIPIALMPKSFVNAVLLAWWSVPASGFIFFLFFGFGEEAMNEYRIIWAWVKRNMSTLTKLEKEASGKRKTSISVPNRGYPGDPNCKAKSSWPPSSMDRFLNSSSSGTCFTPSTITGAPLAHRQRVPYDMSSLSPTSTAFSAPSLPNIRSPGLGYEKTWKVELSKSNTDETDGLDSDDTQTLSFYSSYTSHPDGGPSPTSPVTSRLPPVDLSPHFSSDNLLYTTQVRRASITRDRTWSIGSETHYEPPQPPSPISPSPQPAGPEPWTTPPGHLPTVHCPSAYRMVTVDRGAFRMLGSSILAYHRPFSPPSLAEIPPSSMAPAPAIPRQRSRDLFSIV